MVTLLISGSMHASERMERYAALRVRSANERGWRIVCGDNPRGIDRVVITEAAKEYLVVVGIDPQPRFITGIRFTYEQFDASAYDNRRDAFHARDRYMVDQSDMGLFITTRDGTPGTLAAYQYANSKGVRYQRWLVQPRGGVMKITQFSVFSIHER